MADHTGIQWTEATWNPVAGCRKVSAGCDHCYAIRDANRLASAPSEKTRAVYEGLTQVQNGRLNWTGVFKELPDRLYQPLRWTKPRRIFVNSMSDLFGEGISEDYIAAVFRVMRDALQHQFQILTKRPERMAYIVPRLVGHEPYPNVWLGVSVEDQKAADLRIPFLLRTPAAVRFLSCEPLLGPVSLEPWLWQPECSRLDNLLHWVIAGGESGPGARELRPGWVLDLKQQCERGSVPLFVKQVGTVWAREEGYAHPKGGDSDEWPLWLRVREFPEAAV